MYHYRYRGFLGLSLLIGALTGCGVIGSQYIPYDEGGAAGVCPNSLAAYTQNLASVFTATGCSCHTASAPVIRGDNAADSASFLQAASKRGTPQALVEYLINGGHTGSSDASARSAELNAWAAACAG